MVFIHPVILKDQQHSAEVSKARYNFMRDEQKQAQQTETTTTTRKAEAAELEDFNTFSKPNRQLKNTPETKAP